MKLSFDKVTVCAGEKCYRAVLNGSAWWVVSLLSSSGEESTVIGNVYPPLGGEGGWRAEATSTGRPISEEADLLTAIEALIKHSRDIEKLNRAALFAVDGYETVARRNRLDWAKFVDEAFQDITEISAEVVELAENTGLVDYSERLVDELFLSLVDVHVRARVVQWHADVHAEKPY